MSGKAPLFARVRSRWQAAPLAVVFTVYLALYLVVATGASALFVDIVYIPGLVGSYTLSNGHVVNEDTRLYLGPYVYDAATDELMPASQIDLPGDDATVFVGTPHSRTSSQRTQGNEYVYGSLEDVRAGTLWLFDWGENFTSDEQMDAVLSNQDSLNADTIAQYCATQQRERLNAVDTVASAFAADVPLTNIAFYLNVNEGNIQNVGWMVKSALYQMAPVFIYGGLAWVMFRRFYRIYIATPLRELETAAQRIAGADLDFTVPRIFGRELGHLACIMEDMRSSLLRAHRELWGTAEERRRLNAAFAHDLRTPLTVLKGSIEMAQMRSEQGQILDADAFLGLSSQVERLEKYADAMSGLAKLDDRPVVRDEVGAEALIAALEQRSRAAVAAQRPELSVDVAVTTGVSTVQVDLALVEEVLDNLMSNACAHAAARIEVALFCTPGSVAICVTDDGPGFSAEALHRACEAFYGEAKSAEHLGLGLNIASTLTRLHRGSLVLENVQDEGWGARVTASFACKGDEE